MNEYAKTKFDMANFSFLFVIYGESKSQYIKKNYFRGSVVSQRDTKWRDFNIDNAGMAKDL
jgi:hypothetical protein